MGLFDAVGAVIIQRGSRILRDQDQRHLSHGMKEETDGILGRFFLTGCLLFVLMAVPPDADRLDDDPILFGVETSGVQPGALHLFADGLGLELYQVIAVVQVIDELFARQQRSEVNRRPFP